MKAEIDMGMDASAAIGVIKRRGIGKMRHVEVQHLWLQDALREGRLRVFKIPTNENTADIGTKPLDARTLGRHIAALGLILY